MSRDQVFISYSHKDKKWSDDLDTHLKPYSRGGSIESWSDQQIAPGSEWFRQIQAALTNSKVAVLLVSPDFLASDFIHEHELGPLLKEAEQGGVKILWVPLRESAYKQTPLKNYQAVLDPSKPLAAMTKAKRDQAWVKICEAIEKAVNPSAPEIPAPPVSPVYFQSPPLPQHFVERPTTFRALKDRLFADPVGSSVPKVSALQALSGAGKTTLAIAITQDLDVRRYFSDGVIWLSLGINPNINALLRDLVELLDPGKVRLTTQEILQEHLRMLLAGKSRLLVLDDVWDPEHALPFFPQKPPCQVLITCRRVIVAEQLGADLVPWFEMEENEVLDLFSKSLGYKLNGADREVAIDLAEKVGRLPIALYSISRRILRGTQWSELNDALTEEVSRLEILDVPSQLRRNKGEAVVEAVFNVSLEALCGYAPEACESFAWLGVLHDTALITPSLAATLWGLDPSDAADRLEILWNEALIVSVDSDEPLLDRRFRRFQVHDLLHDVAVRRLIRVPPDGMGVSLQKAHSELLDRYRSNAHCWHAIRPDGYIHEHLVWHLEKAGRIDEIHELLAEKAEDGRNGWYEARESLGQTAGYLTDLARAWELTSPRSIERQCRYALMIASINSAAQNISSKLLLALVERKEWMPLQGIAYCRRILDPEEKAITLFALAKYFPESLREAIFSEAIQVTRQIGIERRKQVAMQLASQVALANSKLMRDLLEIATTFGLERYQALSDIAYSFPYSLPSDLLRDTISKFTIDNRKEKEATLYLTVSALACRLDPVSLGHVLTEVRLLSPKWRAFSLIELFPYFPEVELEMINAIDAMRKTEDRLNALKRLKNLKRFEKDARSQDRVRRSEILPSNIPTNFSPRAVTKIYEDGLTACLSPDSHRKILRIALTSWKRHKRYVALATIAEFVSSDSLPPITEALSIHSDEEARARVLRPLARRLPSVAAEAFKSVQELTDKRTRGKRLEELAPYLPAELFHEAIVAAQALEKDDLTASVLIAAAPNFAKAGHGTLQLAWDAARAIQSGHDRQKALRALGPHVCSALLTKELSVARKHHGDKAFVHALEAWLRYLDKADLRHIKKAADGIKNPLWRAWAFVALLPRMRRADKALEAVEQIPDESGFSKRRVLYSLIPYLTADLVPHALELLGAFHDRNNRVQAIDLLLPHLSAAQTREALHLVGSLNDSDYRLLTLSGLASYLPSVSHETYREAREIRDDFLRIEALVSLGPHEPAALSQVLDEMKRLKQDDIFVDRLSALAPHLDAPLLLDTFTYVQRTIGLDRSGRHPDWNKAIALKTLIPRLPSELLTQALQTISSIGDDERRADALRALCARLPDIALDPLLEVVYNVRRPELVFQLFGEMAGHLPEEWKGCLLIEIEKFEKPSHWIKALDAIAPHLGDTLVLEVLRRFLTTAKENKQSKILRIISPYLNDDGLLEAIELIARTQTGRNKANALGILSEFLSPSLIPRAIQIAQEIPDTSSRTWALVHFGGNLTEDLLNKVFRNVQALELRNVRAQAFARFIQCGKGDVDRVLNRVKALLKELDPNDAVRALELLAPSITPSLQTKALRIIERLAERTSCLPALRALAKYLDEVHQMEAVKIVASLYDDEIAMRELLQMLVPHLSVAAQEEAVRVASKMSEPADEICLLAPQLTGSSVTAAFEVLTKMKADSDYWFNAIINLTPRLPPELQVKALEMFVTFAGNRPYEDGVYLRVPKGFVEAVLQTPLEQGVAFLERALHFLARGTGRDLLQDLRALSPIIFAVGGESAIADLRDAIRDISAQWP